MTQLLQQVQYFNILAIQSRSQVIISGGSRVEGFPLKICDGPVIKLINQVLQADFQTEVTLTTEEQHDRTFIVQLQNKTGVHFAIKTGGPVEIANHYNTSFKDGYIRVILSWLICLIRRLNKCTRENDDTVLGHLLGQFHELFRCPKLCTMNLQLKISCPSQSLNFIC